MPFPFPVLDVNHYSVDKLAVLYLDGEYPSLVLLAVGADGNCLFRAASLLSHGDERHHGKLRPLVTGELREHSSFYFDDFVRRAEMQRATNKSLSLASLLSQTLSKAASNTFLMSLSGGLTLSDAFIKSIEHQCSLRRRPGTWAGILGRAGIQPTQYNCGGVTSKEGHRSQSSRVWIQLSLFRRQSSQK